MYRRGPSGTNSGRSALVEKRFWDWRIDCSRLNNLFLENSRSRGGRFALQTGFLGKPALGARKRATPLKNAAIAVVSGNGGKRGRAMDFIDSLGPSGTNSGRSALVEKRFWDWRIDCSRLNNLFLENSRSRGGWFVLQTGFLGKPALGARKRATPLKNAAIAAVSGNGGKRGRAIDFIDSLGPSGTNSGRSFSMWAIVSEEQAWYN